MTPSELAWLLGQAGTGALVLSRVLGLAWTAPGLAVPGADWRSRLALALVLGAILIPAVSSQVAVPIGLDALGKACLVEAVVGAALGWSAALIVAGARQAGEIVGAQAGLSAASLFDPDAGEEMTALGHWYGLVALAIFLALDGPLVLVQALVESYRVAPVGGVTLSEETATLAFARVGQALELALRAAAPPALALALAGVALGLLGKAAPSLPLVTLSMPVRSVIGLIVVGLGMATLAVTIAGAWTSWPGGG